MKIEGMSAGEISARRALQLVVRKTGTGSRRERREFMARELIADRGSTHANDIALVEHALAMLGWDKGDK